MQKLQEWSEINLKIILSPRVLWYGNGNTVDCICFNWRLYASCTIISYIKNILCHTIRVYYITSLWAIKKMHVRLSTFSCWHVFHCIDWAWGTTSGTVRCICHRVRILIDWRILKIAVLNPERLNILINRYTLSSNNVGPAFGNSSLMFIKARELFFNIGGECRALYSWWFNQGRIYVIGSALCK